MNSTLLAPLNAAIAKEEVAAAFSTPPDRRMKGRMPTLIGSQPPARVIVEREVHVEHGRTATERTGHGGEERVARLADHIELAPP